MTNHHGDEREPEALISSLQPDAEWKNIQQNTFTRWVNNHLKKVPDEIANLETDFSDGLKLIKLVEVLAQRHVGRYSTLVKFRHQKLENVSVALNFLQEDEGIKIVNIDSSAIVDQNKKLIMGLIWTLILHYSIAIHMEDEAKSGEPDKTPKQRLLQWIRTRLPQDVPVTNFTSDWNDGVALGGLVNTIVPDQLADWREWEPDNALFNTRKAMDVASSELNVAPLITPEELINPNVDEKSVMTYLAQFPQVKPPMRKGKLYGIAETAVINRPCEFRVSMPSDELKPKISIFDAQGNNINFNLHKLPGTNDYVGKFTPDRLGTTIIHLQTSSASTGETVQSDSAEISVVSGPKLRNFAGVSKLNEPVRLEIEDAPDGVVDVIVLDPTGEKSVLLVLHDSEEGCHSAEYIPTTTGAHAVNVFYRDEPLEGNPFKLLVNYKNSWDVYGRGLASVGVCVDEKVPIYVQPSSSSIESDVETAPISVEVLDERQRRVPLARSIFDNRAKFEYTPTSEGLYKVSISEDGRLLGQSPYEVKVGPKSSSLIRAFGPGLEGGVALQPNVFYVDTRGDSDNLAFTIEGPSKTVIEVSDRGYGQALVQYTPIESGVYKINILKDTKHIKDSPFVVWVDPADSSVHASAVQVSGLESKKAARGEELVFQIDTTNAGIDLTPQVDIIDAAYQRQVPSMREVNPGIFECSYTPNINGSHFVNVGVRGIAVPGSPFPVTVEDPIDISKLRIFGPGVDGPVISQQPTHFTIDAKQAGPGAVEVALADRNGRAVDIDVLDNQDGSFTVKYTAPRPGAYQLNVVFAGVDGPPIEINVKPHVDRTGIRVEGLENANVLCGHTANFKINVGNNVAHSSGLQLIAVNPEGRYGAVPLKLCENGDYTGHYLATNYGVHNFELLFDGEHIVDSKLVVIPGLDVSKCRAEGDGLNHGVVDEKTSFIVHTQGAGEGDLSIEISGPKEAETDIFDFKNGSCEVSYVAHAPGIYRVSITYGEENDRKQIPGSPFVAEFDYRRDPSQVTIKAGENGEIVARPGEPIIIHVDASTTKELPITVELPKGQKDAEILSGPERGKYMIKTEAVGQKGDVYPVRIFYDGEEIKESPLNVKVIAICEPEKAKLESPSYIAKVHPGENIIVELDVSDCGAVNLVEALVTRPDGHVIRLPATQISEHRYEVVAPTNLVGNYQIEAFVNGDNVGKSVNVKLDAAGDLNAIQIIEKPTAEQWLLNEDKYVVLKRLVDEPDAHVNVLAYPAAGVETVMSRDVQKGDHLEYIRIRPVQIGKQTVNVLYGGLVVPNAALSFEVINELSTSEFAALHREHELHEKSCSSAARSREPFPSELCADAGVLNSPVEVRREEIIEEAERRYYGLFDDSQSPQKLYEAPPDVFPQREFILPVTSGCLKDFTAEVLTPSKMRDQAQIIDNCDGTITVKYTPVSPGQHELYIKHRERPLTKTPISFFVEPSSTVPATVYGKGIASAVVGKPASFTVSSKGFESRDLSVSIEGPKKATIEVQDNNDSTCTVFWTPTTAGEYKIHVRLGKTELANSPFIVHAQNKTEKNRHSFYELGPNAEIAIDASQPDSKNLTATIKAPSGVVSPCCVRELTNGKLGVSFRPKEVGKHYISLYCNGELVPKGPFMVKFSKDHLGNPSKVKVYGITPAKTHVDNEFFVDTSKAGYGSLSINLQGPSKAVITCKEPQIGLIAVNWKPFEPGNYIITAKFSDEEVPGSPFSVEATGEGANLTTSQQVHEASAVETAKAGCEANMYLSFPHTKLGDMSAFLTNPLSQNQPATIAETSPGSGHYIVTFKPMVDGTHFLSVLHGKEHVIGSPFAFTVGLPANGGAQSVRASGLGIVRGEVDVPNSFNIYSREAGSGPLSVAVKGPSKANIHFRDSKDGSCLVDYVVDAPGEYEVNVFFCDKPIHDSPFKVFIAPKGETNLHRLDRQQLTSIENSLGTGVQDVASVVASGSGLSHFTPGEAAKFTIDTGANDTNVLLVGVVTTKGPCHEVVIKHMGSGHYVVSYQIQDNVDGYIFVRYGNRDIPGSPFPIRASSSNSSA